MTKWIGWVAAAALATGCTEMDDAPGAAEPPATREAAPVQPEQPPAAAPTAPAEAEAAPEAGSDTPAAGDDAAAREACVDAWLRERGLNEYGDPPGTMYTGGTPLFDERTGTARERIPYVMEKRPELREACP